VNLHQPALHAGALEGGIRSGGLDGQTRHKSKTARTGNRRWKSEVRMVEKIEEAAAEFELHALTYILVGISDRNSGMS
jgi:hypothetical protein